MQRSCLELLQLGHREQLDAGHEGFEGSANVTFGRLGNFPQLTSAPRNLAPLSVGRMRMSNAAMPHKTDRVEASDADV
jgi:hypothetical protein